MKFIPISILFVCLFSCSHSPQQKKDVSIMQRDLQRQLAKQNGKIYKCLARRVRPSTITLYLDINSSGTIENITVLPLVPRAIQQCISLSLSAVRFRKKDRKRYKLKQVIKF